jgi:hypothetical protein
MEGEIKFNILKEYIYAKNSFTSAKCVKISLAWLYKISSIL